MKRLLLAALAVAATLTLLPAEAEAVTCARGVYRAGCAGPNGAVVARKPPPPVYRRPTTVACGAGPYRAGCVRRY